MSSPKTCHKCSQPACYIRPHGKLPLCLTHFNESFVRRVKKTILDNNLIKRNERIAVGVSGGKDSIALLTVLHELKKDLSSELVVITIDEGIANYREDSVKYAKLAAEKFDLEHHIYSFKDLFGYSLDEIIAIDAKTERSLGACSFCGILRRRALNVVAREAGVNVLCTGHNQDDEAQTVIMNVLRGEVLRIMRSNPTPNKKHRSLIPRAKPFRRTPEEEIVLYCVLNDLPYQEVSCSYAVEASRGPLRDFMLDYQNIYPSTGMNVISSADKILELASQLKEPLNNKYSKRKIDTCPECGEISSSGQCKVCEVISYLKEKEES
ncbi:MAG: TIGR00269 family protein [Candidatus Heimdallarchaeota archaeon]|nr:TIGR00269 family protein [Candidatus Heimdallarchaeota archaeon]MCK5050015.1 TIGR00269 family protein [Candidatus Heimdallarchaeota archaeon]